jgi:hypothetical protein
VTDAAPDTPPEVALMDTVPPALPVTFPLELTLAMWESEVDH